MEMIDIYCSDSIVDLLLLLPLPAARGRLLRCGLVDLSRRVTKHVLPCRATLAPPTTAAPRRLGLTSGPLARLLETSRVRGLDRFDGETEAVQMSTCRK